MRTLEKIPVREAMTWPGVCAEFGSGKTYDGFSWGNASFNALDAINTPDDELTPPDKLWAILRVRALDQEILDAVVPRILEGLPNDCERHTIMAWRKTALDNFVPGDEYWDISRHTTAFVVASNIRTRDEENRRQLAIVKEEIEKWLAAG